MGLSAVRGQEQAVGILKRCVAEGRVAHAYLFHGPDGVGKELAAANFAKLLACRSPKGGDACDFCAECLAVEKNIHPDILWPRPSGKRRIIPIGDVDNPEEGSVRYFQRRVALKPFQARWKIGIFVDADSMEGPAENALLKTLEEPPARTVIVLLSARPESLLPTTLSRCQAVRFGPMREAELEKLLREEHRMPAADAKALSRMTEGRYGEAVKLLGKLESRFPFGTWAQQAQLDTAFAHYKEGDRTQALISIERFIRLYPTSDQLDYAYYLKGLINFNEDSGLLSVWTQEAAEVELAFRVSANCFRPRPTVGSAVVHLRINTQEGFEPVRHERFRRLVRASFAHRRKTLVNSLRDEGYPSEQIARATAEAGVPPQARAEMLTLDDYRTLARAFDRDPV